MTEKFVVHIALELSDPNVNVFPFSDLEPTADAGEFHRLSDVQEPCRVNSVDVVFDFVSVRFCLGRQRLGPNHWAERSCGQDG